MEKGIKGLEPRFIWLMKVLGKETDSMWGKTILPPLSGNCWWGNTGSDGEGRLLELISLSKSHKLAFSESQQYKALFFFSRLNELVNTLKFTFPRAVDQRRHQCLLRLVSERVL